jgi:voltage-gated potassium channel
MNFRSDFDQNLYENRYIYLFIATILQVFLVSFFPGRSSLLINELTFSFFMLASINLIRHSKRIIAFMIFFASTSILLVWIPDQSDLGQKLYPYERLIILLFICVVIYQILHQMIISKKVSANVIFGALTIYIFLGMLASTSNQLIYFFDRHAFVGNINIADDIDLNYYSYVTMTTLGYGDITPVSKIARAASVFFSLAGQLYLAVIVALIVGKYISHSDKEKEERERK